MSSRENGSKSHLFWEGCREAATLSSQNLRMANVLRAWSALGREKRKKACDDQAHTCFYVELNGKAALHLGLNKGILEKGGQERKEGVLFVREGQRTGLQRMLWSTHSNTHPTLLLPLLYLAEILL